MIGRRLLDEELEDIGIEHARVEEQRLEALARVRILATRAIEVAAEPSVGVRQRGTAMPKHELDARVLQKMPGEQQSRDRDRGIGDATDRIDEIVVGDTRIAAQKHRVQEDASFEIGCRLPERVETGIVQTTASNAERLCTDHRTCESALERLGKHLRGQATILQR